jgi:hypothetical protein
VSPNAAIVLLRRRAARATIQPIMVLLAVAGIVVGLLLTEWLRRLLMGDE